MGVGAFMPVTVCLNAPHRLPFYLPAADPHRFTLKQVRYQTALPLPKAWRSCRIRSFTHSYKRLMDKRYSHF